MNAEVNKELIFSYLSGKSTALQKQLVDAWVKEPAHEELFYQWLVEYEYQQPQYLAQVDEAIHRFRTYANRRDELPLNAREVQNSDPGRPRKWFWLVAASISMLLAAGGWVFRDTLRYQTYSSLADDTKTFILSDSTRVILHANSSLQIPRFGFGRKSREVFLRGEANFDVAHQADNQRFVVRTGKGIEVVVLGTEFTVYARAEKSKVILNRGKVQLRYQEGKAQKQILMRPGERVTLDQNNRVEQQVLTRTDRKTAATNHRFIFDDTTLAELAEMMQESYGLRVVIPEERLAQRTLVGSFRAENPQELLEIVSQLFNVEIEKLDGTLVIKSR